MLQGSFPPCGSQLLLDELCLDRHSLIVLCIQILPCLFGNLLVMQDCKMLSCNLTLQLHDLLILCGYLRRRLLVLGL